MTAPTRVYGYPERFYSDWRQAPVPGWGKRPETAGPRRVGIGGFPLPYHQGFGMNVTVSTPVGDQTISVPVEKIAQKAAAEAWPPIQKKLEESLPGLLGLAEKQVLNSLWPKLQPKIRGEVDYALGQAKTLGFVVGAAVVGSIWLAAYWVRRGQRGG